MEPIALLLVRASAAVLGCGWAFTASGTLLPPSATSFWFMTAGGLFEALYFVALGKALQQAPLGVVYPAARGGAMLLVWPLSVALGLWGSGRMNRDAFDLGWA